MLDFGPSSFIRVNGNSTTTAAIPFTEGLSVPTNKTITFRDSALKISSSADGYLEIEADTLLTLGTVGDVEIGDGTLRTMFPQTTLKIDLGKTANVFNELHVKDIYSADYCSVTTTANSTAATTTRDVFDQDTYSAYTSDANVTAKGVTYTSTDGKFTIDNAGIWVITCSVNVMINSTDEVDLEVQVNGSPFYNHDTMIHSSTDPTTLTHSFVKSLAASDYINVLCGSTDGVDSCTFYGGCTFTMHKIAGA